MSTPNLDSLLRRHTHATPCADEDLFLLLDEVELEVGVGISPAAGSVLKNHRLRPALHVVLKQSSFNNQGPKN